MVLHPLSGWFNSTWQDLQCGLWVGVEYHVADTRDSREYADREVSGKTAREIRWNYAGEDRLLGCADGDMLGCEDGRRSAAERLSSSQSARPPTSPHSASRWATETATSIVAVPLFIPRLQQSNLPRRTPPLFQDPHIHYHSFISAGPTIMSSPRTGSRSRLPKLQPGGRQKQTAPQESPLPSRAHANQGHSEGSTHSITLGCPVVGSSETRTGDGSASAGRWTG
jgi:hypothetical protein